LRRPRAQISSRARDEGVVGRDPIRLPHHRDRARREARPDVDAQHLSEQALRILRELEGIVRSAAVSRREPEEVVEHAVLEGAPFVVREAGAVGLVDEQQGLFAVGVGDVRVGRDREARHHRVEVQIRVVDREQPGRRVVAREGEAEQAALTPGADAALDVEEGGRLHDAVHDHADAPRTLDDEEPRVPTRGGSEERAREPGRDDDGLHLLRGRGARAEQDEADERTPEDAAKSQHVDTLPIEATMIPDSRARARRAPHPRRPRRLASGVPIAPREGR
jgi:hypothetical protein